MERHRRNFVLIDLYLTRKLLSNSTYTLCGREVHTIFWMGNLKLQDHTEYLDVDGTIILKWILGK